MLKWKCVDYIQSEYLYFILMCFNAFMYITHKYNKNTKILHVAELHLAKNATSVPLNVNE